MIFWETSRSPCLYLWVGGANHFSSEAGSFLCGGGLVCVPMSGVLKFVSWSYVSWFFCGVGLVHSPFIRFVSLGVFLFCFGVLCWWCFTIRLWCSRSSWWEGVFSHPWCAITFCTWFFVLFSYISKNCYNNQTTINFFFLSVTHWYRIT